MLAFYLNNQPFLLAEKTSITIEKVNPAWEFEEYKGDLGLDITIPFNEVNAMLLGHPDRFEKFRKGLAYEFDGFRVEVDGIVKLQGTLVIYEALTDYRGWCRSEVGNIGRDYLERYISDSFSFNQEQTLARSWDYRPGSSDYDCPTIFNPEFFSGKGEEVKVSRTVENPNHIPADWNWDEDETILEDEQVPKGEKVEDLTLAFFKNAGWYVNNISGLLLFHQSSVSDFDNRKIAEQLKVFAISPMLYLNKVLELVFRDAKFPIGDNFLANDDDLKRLIVYNNFDITKTSFSYGTSTLRFNPYTRIYDVSYVVSTIKRSLDDAIFTYADLLPKIKLPNFIMSVQNLLNVFLFPRGVRRMMDIIDRERIFTEAAIDISQYMVGRWKMGEKKNVTLKFSFDHDSSDTYFNERFHNIDDYRDREKQAVATATDLENVDAEIGDLRFVRDEQRFYRYKLIIDEEETGDDDELITTRRIGWQEVSVGFQNGYFNYGQDDEEEIKTNFSTLLGETNPIAEQPGNTNSELFEYASFSPRLLFSLGSLHAKYETNNLRMDWEDPEKGLLAKRWPNTARFWCQRQPVERDARLPHNAIDYIERNIWRRFITDEGQFVIQKIRTSYGMHSIGATTINGFKLEYAPKTYTLGEIWNIGDVIWLDEELNFDDADVWNSYPLII